MKLASSIVLDSSAVLAMVLKEPGGKKLEAQLDEIDAASDIEIAISAVNWCETLTKLHRNNDAMTAQELTTLLAGVEIVPFDKVTAELAAELAKRSGALSLGDRACLALAIARKARAWTTDKMWASLKLPVRVEFLR